VVVLVVLAERLRGLVQLAQPLAVVALELGEQPLRTKTVVVEQ
jgi:hypothetical protein